VKSTDLYELVRSSLEVKARSAPDIGRSLGVPKAEINSCLYEGRGVDFVRDNGKPPMWRLVAKNVEQKVWSPSLLDRRISGDIHIDFQGGDWVVEIRMVERSWNDPVAVVEILGKRQRLITVSSQVVSAREKAFQEAEPGLPDSAIAIAAAALSWEIQKDLLSENAHEFDHAIAITSILLSIAAHARSLSV
jgi:hypothetical protein